MDEAEKIMFVFWIIGMILGYHVFGIFGIVIGAQLVWIPWFYYVFKL